jgi:hypothetical protein
MSVFCEACKLFMDKIEQGIVVKDHIYFRHGDRFKCTKCGLQVISDFGERFR